MNDKRDKDLLIFACKSNNNTLKKIHNETEN